MVMHTEHRHIQGAGTFQCPVCAERDQQLRELEDYVNNHVHAFIDCDSIERLMSFDEWLAIKQEGE